MAVLTLVFLLRVLFVNSYISMFHRASLIFNQLVIAFFIIVQLIRKQSVQFRDEGFEESIVATVCLMLAIVFALALARIIMVLINQGKTNLSKQ